MDQHLLSIVLFTPLAGLAILLLIPGKSKDLIRIWANLVGFGAFLFSLRLVKLFQVGAPGFQFEERVDWIPSLGAHYHIGMDGISLDRKSTRLNSSHLVISYAVFCLKK